MKTERRILSVLLLALLLCGCSKSAERYTVVNSWEPKPGEQLYAYTVEMPEDIRKKIEETHDPDSIGYLLPVHFPDHLEKTFAGKEAYWCTIHDKDGALLYIVQVNVSFSSLLHKQINLVTGYAGSLGGSGIPGADYWTDRAGYTSKEQPLSVYMESVCTFIVIGDNAYCLKDRPQGDMAKTDSFTVEAGAVVKDILHK